MLALLGCLPNHRYLKTLLLSLIVRTALGKAVTTTCYCWDGGALAAVRVFDGNRLILVAEVAND
jgi:hypothetical protein